MVLAPATCNAGTSVRQAMRTFACGSAFSSFQLVHESSQRTHGRLLAQQGDVTSREPLCTSCYGGIIDVTALIDG